jgi:fructose-specific phosphotransferase system IIC component
MSMISYDVSVAIQNNVWGAILGLVLGFMIGYIVRGQKQVKEETHLVLTTIENYVLKCEEILTAAREKENTDHEDV